jgi:hypothetical protein
VRGDTIEVFPSYEEHAVRLQLFAYANLFAGRFPASISTIGGTGLIAPTF